MKRNCLVDAKNTEQAFRYVEDGIFSYDIGPIDVVTGDAAIELVRPNNAPDIDIGNFRRGELAFLFLQSIDIASDGTQVPGLANWSTVRIYYNDWNNRPHVLGNFHTAEYSKYIRLDKIIPIPLTDPKQLDFGNIEIAAQTGNPAGATASYFFNISYSFAYLSLEADLATLLSDHMQEIRSQYKQIMDSLHYGNLEMVEINGSYT